MASLGQSGSEQDVFLAGGEKLGFKHGQFHKFSEEVPLSNLFVTMMNKLGMPAPSFGDSTGELTEVVG